MKRKIEEEEESPKVPTTTSKRDKPMATSFYAEYQGYQMPLKIVVTKTFLSRPENFVKRNGEKGNVTDLTDPDGAWMNAGSGGDNNTIDVKFELRDHEDKPVKECDIVPIKLRLWTSDNGLICGEHIDEITQNTEIDKSGHRRSTNFMLSGRSSSELHINHNGTGQVSVKVTTTSQLNERRKFCIEVLPDFDMMKESYLFGEFQPVKAGDTLVSNKSLSFPLEVISKINKLAQRRLQNCEFRQANYHLDKSFELLQTRVAKKGLLLTEMQELSAKLWTLSTILTGVPNLPTLPNLDISIGEKGKDMEKKENGEGSDGEHDERKDGGHENSHGMNGVTVNLPELKLELPMTEGLMKDLKEKFEKQQAEQA